MKTVKIICAGLFIKGVRIWVSFCNHRDCEGCFNSKLLTNNKSNFKFNPDYFPSVPSSNTNNLGE
jgi:hypothetical protein